MSELEYDQIISLFSSAKFNIKNFVLGDTGYRNLGPEFWIEFMAFKPNREIQVDVNAAGKELQNIRIHNIDEVKFLLNTFRINGNPDRKSEVNIDQTG